MASRRVVVTGLGLVSPLGDSVAAAWPRLLAGDCGVVSLAGRSHAPTASAYTRASCGPSLVAALVQTPIDDLAKSAGADKHKMAPFAIYAMEAARQALVDAQWSPTTESDLDRTGVCVGSGIGCMDDIVNVAFAHATHGARKVPPYFVPRLLINMAAGHISIAHGFRGPNHAPVTACTTGAHAIGDAARMIACGDADVMVAGGAEASVSPLAIAGFARVRALATKFNDRPTAASRPFDRDRDGFVIGEGAGIVVLEDRAHAIARRAHIYAEVAGYGLSGDAVHITAPPADGRGAVRAMRRALATAGLADTPHEVDYVNAHATSTDLGDLAESRAIHTVFGPRVAVSSTKGATGHLLGAAGAVEAIFTILALHTDTIPPSLNLDTPLSLTQPDPETDGDRDNSDDIRLDFVANKARHLRNVPRRCHVGTGLRVALTNSFGFGGTNASLVFVRHD